MVSDGGSSVWCICFCLLATGAIAWGPAVHRTAVLASLNALGMKDAPPKLLLLAGTFADAFRSSAPALHDLERASCVVLHAQNDLENALAYSLAMHIVSDIAGDAAFLRWHPPLHADEVLADALLLWGSVAVRSPFLAPTILSRGNCTVPNEDDETFSAFAQAFNALLQRSATTCGGNGSGGWNTATSEGIERAARLFEHLARADVLTTHFHGRHGLGVMLYSLFGNLDELQRTLDCVGDACVYWARALDSCRTSMTKNMCASEAAKRTFQRVEWLQRIGACIISEDNQSISGKTWPSLMIFSVLAWTIVVAMYFMFRRRRMHY